MMTYPDRIPYNSRANSQLSVAKYYGGIIIQGEEYILDYDNCKKETRDGEEYYYPDLIKFSTLKVKKTKTKKSQPDTSQIFTSL